MIHYKKRTYNKNKKHTKVSNNAIAAIVILLIFAAIIICLKNFPFKKTSNSKTEDKNDNVETTHAPTEKPISKDLEEELQSNKSTQQADIYKINEERKEFKNDPEPIEELISEKLKKTIEEELIKIEPLIDQTQLQEQKTNYGAKSPQYRVYTHPLTEEQQEILKELKTSHVNDLYKANTKEKFNKTINNLFNVSVEEFEKVLCTTLPKELSNAKEILFITLKNIYMYRYLQYSHLLNPQQKTSTDRFEQELI